MHKSKSGVFTVLILLVAVLVYHSFRYTEAPTLTIENGRIKGLIFYSRQGRPFAAYRGIPYAIPPEGSLRFQPPKPALNWNGTRDATRHGPLCAQYNLLSRMYEGEENCLYLSVFSPNLMIGHDQVNTTQSKGLLPVIVYFPGGYFQLGGPSMHDPAYVMDTDIVLVMVSYRLGAFGFLSTGDNEVPGNMGLKDQVLSLIWTQKNVHHFGGDPNKVTISGTSAGGASVQYHMMSNQSKGLFRRAISSSGTALAPWAMFSKPKKQAQRLAEKLNCPNGTSVEMVACLRAKSAKEIGYASEDTAYPTRSGIDLFVPVIEPKGKDRFLSTSPIEILKSGQYSRVPWLGGVMASEGKFFATPLRTNETFLKIMRTQWEEYGVKVLSLENNPEFSKRVRSHYLPGHEKLTDEEYLEKFDIHATAIGDGTFNFPLHTSAQLQSKFSPVFLYHFNYTTDYSVLTIMAAIRGRLPIVLEIGMSIVEHIIHRKILGTFPPFHETSHGDDLVLQFGLPIPGVWIGEGHPDYEMSLDLVQAMSDFASVEDLRHFSFRNVSWLPNDSEAETQKFMEISDQPSMIDSPFAKRMKFWEQYYKYQ